jgi:hypothetical protein
MGFLIEIVKLKVTNIRRRNIHCENKIIPE